MNKNIPDLRKRNKKCCEKKVNRFFCKLIHRVQHLPIALTGLALGLCGISAVLDVIAHQNHGYGPDLWWVSIGFIAIATVLLLLVTIRNIAHPKVLGFDTKDPLLASFLPTYSMTLMCIAGFIAGWQKGHSGVPPCQVIGAILMCLAVLIQIAFIFLFIKNILTKHKWHEESMYGSWLVPTVGPATACTFAGRFNEGILPVGFFQAIWFFAFGTYVILFIFVTYALLFKKQADKDKFPSIAVYFAPANLTLAGFLQTFALPSVSGPYNTLPVEVQAFMGHDNAFINAMLILMAAMAFTFTIILWFFVIRIFIINKFTYIFASLTFPLAIGAGAMVYLHAYIEKSIVIFDHNQANSFIQLLSSFTMYIGYIFTGVATCIILFIAVRFLILLVKALATSVNDDKTHKVYCCETTSDNQEKVVCIDINNK